MTTVFVLNGPNLGRLGKREPQIYGAITHCELAERLVSLGRELDLDVQVRQSDSEAEMIGWLHEAADNGYPVVLNAGAWSHYSYALGDAASMVDFYVEVHLSNIHAREEFRHRSVLSSNAQGVIVGLGIEGYEYALAHIARSRN